jgi:TolB-like protein/DNA-binding winged helix-turn-helix (wHTH) protein/Tfp pilus assembly protein PilF
MSGVVRFGAFDVDLRSGELHKDGVKIRLQEQPFRLLALLLEHPGEVVTRDELRKRLWPEDTFVAFDDGLNTAIKKLRDGLGDSAEKPRFVETVSRRGYRFIAPVDGAGAPAVSAPGVAGASVPAPATKRVRSRWAVPIVGAVVVLAAALLVSNVIGWRERLLRTPAPTRIRSIAVLPLENLTGDPSQEYFADGMTDALITKLAQIDSLQVTSRTSVLHYKAEKKSLPVIARELGVDAIVEGTVTRAGNRVRIDAQLVRGATDRHLWARSYEGDLGDILVLQDEVTRAIATEVEAKLTPQERARLTSARSVNPEAYDAYLRGRYFVNRKTAAGSNKSVEYFNLAIEKDPGFALPYAGLADAYIGSGFYGGMPPKEAYPRAREAAQKALEIDEKLPEAHSALASIKFFFDWNWLGAEEEFKKAIELNPRYPLAHRRFSYLLVSQGRITEAVNEAKRALELDPLSLAENTSYGWILGLAGQTDAVIEQNRKALELDPNYGPFHGQLALAYVRKGVLDQAIAHSQKATELSKDNPFPLASLGYVYGVAGKKDSARKILGELNRLSRSRYVPAWLTATVYAGLGEKDQAFAWLEKAYAERASELVWLSLQPTLDKFHSDPRLGELAQRVGLPPVNDARSPAEKSSK